MTFGFSNVVSNSLSNNSLNNEYNKDLDENGTNVKSLKKNYNNA